MAAEVKIMGRIEQAVDAWQRDIPGEYVIWVKVGSSNSLRPIRLTARQVWGLVMESMKVLDRDKSWRI